MRGAAPITSKVLPAVLAGAGHGSHLCAFYETKNDLIDLVLPFFAAGLSRRELCVWMTPDGVNVDEAVVRASAAVAERGIELYPARAGYMKGPRFERGPVVDFWNGKLQQALATGHLGMRASGDAFWLQASDWNAFLDYEADLTNMIADKPITLLCTYPLSVSKAGDIFDVASAHHVVIAKRKRAWEIIKGWGITKAPVAHQQQGAEILDAADRIQSLSQRLRQVLDGLADGRPSKVIAHDLGITVRTVEVHRARLLDRLGVRTTAEAIRLATLARLVTQA